MPVPLFFTQELQAVDLPSERLTLDPGASADPEYAHEFGHALAVLGEWARTPEPAWRQTWAAEELRAVFAILATASPIKRQHGFELNRTLSALHDEIQLLVGRLPAGVPLFISAWQDGVTPLVVLTTAAATAPGEPWQELPGATIVRHEDEEMPVEDGEPGETVTIAGGWEIGDRKRGSTEPLVYFALACFGEKPTAPPKEVVGVLGVELDPVHGRSAADAIGVLFGMEPPAVAVRVTRGRLRITPHTRTRH